jgi:hypothetical protein
MRNRFGIVQLLILSSLLILQVKTAGAELRVDTPLFSKGDISAWQHKKFVGETSYRLKQVEDLSVLEAVSDKSASIFYYPIKVDLTKTPVLNWSWRKLQGLNPGDEKEKTGDDFVARVYVVKEGGLLFWNTRAINYVWSYQHQKKEVWDNPFAGSNAKMLVQRDASDADNTWFHESRNVLEDFRQVQGRDIKSIDGIAVMTDSDNSGLTAKAQYGDIYFSEP